MEVSSLRVKVFFLNVAVTILASLSKVRLLVTMAVLAGDLLGPYLCYSQPTRRHATDHCQTSRGNQCPRTLSDAMLFI